MRATGLIRRPSDARTGRIRLPFPHPGQKMPCLEARSGGVDGGGRDGSVAESGGDAVAVAEAPGAGLGTLDAGVGHEGCDAPVGG